VVVEGLNLNKRPVKKTQDNPGGMVSVESPIAYSNVSLIDPVTKHPVKVSWRYLEDGSKVRVTRGNLASGSVIPRPEILLQRRKPKPVSLGSSDTPVELAEKESYVAGTGQLPTALKEFMEEMRSVRRGENEHESIRFKKLRRSVIAK
jgi:large subunit ribosomal protein L24